MLHYFIEGQGKTIVFLHGFLENSKIWTNYSRVLADKYQVLRIDLPGHGESAEISQDVNRMEFMAEKVNEVLDKLKISKAVFIGHSMGGYVALAFAEMFPTKIEALCLFYSTALPDDEAKKEQRLKSAEVIVRNPKEFFRLSIPNLFNPNRLVDFQDEIQFAIKMANETSLKGVAAALKGMRLRPDRTDVISELKIPTLAIIGTYDNAAKANVVRKSLEDLPNVTIVELPTGHMGFLEASEDCLEVIKKWLNLNV